jgi:hypothetical protein
VILYKLCAFLRMGLIKTTVRGIKNIKFTYVSVSIKWAHESHSLFPVWVESLIKISHNVVENL